EGVSDAGERDAEEGDIEQQSQCRMNRDRSRMRRRGREEADKTAEDQAREVERNLMSVHPRHTRLHAGPLLSDRPETMPILCQSASTPAGLAGPSVSSRVQLFQRRVRSTGGRPK